MARRTRAGRPATALYFPLAVMAAFVGLAFGLQLVGLLTLVDLGLRSLVSPYEDMPVIAEADQVRIANYPADRDPVRGVRAKPASADDIVRNLPVVRDELRRYGASVLPRVPLRRVILCSDLISGGRRVGGLTLGGRGVILLDVTRRGPGADDLLRHVFQHEISHILDDLFRRDAGRDARWSQLNAADFTYGGDEVVRALEVLGEDPRGRPDVPGFLTYYAMASPGEDRAEVFAAMMTDPEALSPIIEEDPALGAKCKILRSELVGWNPALAALLKPR